MIKRLLWRWKYRKYRQHGNAMIGFDGYEWIVVNINFVGCTLTNENDRLVIVPVIKDETK